MSSFSDEIVNKCKALVIKKTLCEEEIRGLFIFINNLTAKDRSLANKWPLNLLIKPLQSIWDDGKIDQHEYVILGEIIGYIACVNEIEVNE